MAVSTRLIRRRIKSINNTRKITKAMELVAASKTKRAVQLTLASRTYASTTKRLADEIIHLTDASLHAMLTGKSDVKAQKKTLLILCASDRGLCGGFNGQVIKQMLEFVTKRDADSISVVAIGRYATKAARRAGLNITASFPSISNAPSFLASRPIGTLAIEEFMSGNVDRVFVAYTDYHSPIKQEARVEQILPIIPEKDLDAKKDTTESLEESRIAFEPDPAYVLNILLPKLVRLRIYQALLESAASEHSARMMAMQSATENATGIVDGLTLAFNQARQASITQEISEISAGKAAIE